MYIKSFGRPLSIRGEGESSKVSRSFPQLPAMEFLEPSSVASLLVARGSPLVVQNHIFNKTEHFCISGGKLLNTKSL